MAEETTNTTAEITAENSLYTYYYSDPQSSDYTQHCIAIHTTAKLDNLPWRWHAEKPADDMVDPVWDNNTNGWVENAPKTQAQLVARLQHDTNALITKIDTLGKQQESLQQDSQKINALQQMQASTNAMMGQLTGQLSKFGQAIQEVTVAVNSLNAKQTEETTKKPTANGSSTNTSESVTAEPTQEGGNN
ncbi:hypothetical protein [Lactobacillus gigeriorum]|uniref:Uncharacterized protein n=1 Tax=Lactobacillus gigeriorum DSM 23908 = CRBIP 24.85 TaxID=1423751 RepID=I7LD17_9LACO|nr:hypothetical protein [Lactobacillus gigeriorum]KRN12022.1 hypothetical protein FC38_GL000427 [Lactobacillus gigeriorum DSM 23908 = CRBIP 24.85]CCI86961.1 Putative uncharacterized protein orf56 [Lactobacillus gigeriorum DSM 23908 = CRBIP 24.85]